MADVDISSNSNSSSTAEILGLDDIKVKLDLPQPFKTEGTNSLKADVGTDSHLKLEPLSTDSHLKVDPLKTDSGLTIDLKPVKTDSSMTVDLKPAVVDLCLTLNVGKVPSVCIKQPYDHHIGFTLWGTEIWGYTFSGQQETVVQELHPSPSVALGAVAPARSAPEHAVPDPVVREGGGLRIRVDP